MLLLATNQVVATVRHFCQISWALKTLCPKQLRLDQKKLDFRIMHSEAAIGIYFHYQTKSTPHGTANGGFNAFDHTSTVYMTASLQELTRVFHRSLQLDRACTFSVLAFYIQIKTLFCKNLYIVPVESHLYYSQLALLYDHIHGNQNYLHHFPPTTCMFHFLLS